MGKAILAVFLIAAAGLMLSCAEGEEAAVARTGEDSGGGTKMTDVPIRFVRTGLLRTARFTAFGPAPEPEAFKKLDQWATPKGLLGDPSEFLLLGRNDPPPPPEGGDYGYEYLLTIGPEVDTTGIEVLEIPPGMYAVIRAGFTNITAKWEWLYKWIESEGYSVTGHGFEEHLTLPDKVAPEEMVFDLWLPVEKQQE